MSIEIFGVESGSICALHGIKKGDLLLSVNGNKINDALDYGFYSAAKKVSLVIGRDGKEAVFDFVKGEYEDLGLVFETFLGDRHKGCKNKCVFCFIDQLPPGMRESLYFKDDDERLSYLLGNYITLTNISKSEVERICEFRLSPVNISVHTMNPGLRVEMMKNRSAGEVLQYIEVFDDAGIEMNFQLVLCPGINDGAELEYSIKRLCGVKNLSSIAVVPVGLTGHRGKELAPLRPFSASEAAAVIDTVEAFAGEFCGEREGALMASDEFYLLAGRSLPAAEKYGDFPQLENGVGMLALLCEEFGEALEAAAADAISVKNDRRLVITGEAAFTHIRGLVDSFNAAFGTAHAVVAAKNAFFGGSVTVTGLLTGSDIVECCKAMDLTEYGKILLCDNMLKHESDLFLDDMTLGGLSSSLGKEIAAVQNNGNSLLSALAE